MHIFNTKSVVIFFLFLLNQLLSYKISCLTCKKKNNFKCDAQYIGSTKQTFRNRQNGHRGHIRNKNINLSKLYKHFNSYSCSGNNDNLKYYSFTPLKAIKKKENGIEDDIYNEYLLCKEEREHQAIFGTIHYGLNGTADWNNCNEMRGHI